MEKNKKKLKKNIKVKRKLKLKPFLISFGIILVILLIIYLLSLIKIKNIYVKGNNYLTDQEIIDISSLNNYPSLIKVNSKKIKKKLLKNEFIKNVKVNKTIKGKVVIKVEEYKPLFRKQDNNKIVLNNKKEIDSNIIVPILVNYIPDTKYDEFINKMNDIDDSIIKMISEIRYYPNNQDDDRFLLNMTDGNLVYLTLTRFKQINYYMDVLKEIDGKKGILYLDSGNHFKVMD